MTDVVLHPGRDRSLRRRHPWLLSGAVERIEGPAAPGAWVRVVSVDGEPLGFGHLSPASRLRVRMLWFGKEDPGEGCLERGICQAVARRAEDPLIGDTDAVRLINGEGDGLPGLVADRYAGVVVVKMTSAGMEARRVRIAEALRAASGATVGFERAETHAARREGIAARQGPLWGSKPEIPVWIREDDRRYAVDVVSGQKTGFYLDQRDARRLVQRLARGRRTIDLFSYTGGFAVAAARGGARSLTLVDSSAESLALAGENLRANAPDADAELVRADAFRYVRGSGSAFDLLVVDPPPLARQRRDLPRASRAYKDVLLFALRRAAPEAYLVCFACSHHVGPDLFRKIAFAASLDAGRRVRVLAQLGAPADHPVSLAHPEGAYLTGLLLRT